MRNIREKRIANPYAKTKASQIKVPTLEDTDLDELAEDPNAFFSDSINRAKLFGMDVKDLKLTLAEYAERKGIDNAALIKSVITEIEWP